MKIAVIGAGAIGCVVAGYLMLKDEDVTLVARQDAVEAIARHGLRISGVKGDYTVRLPVVSSLFEAPELAIFCTKTQDLEEAIVAYKPFLKGAALLTTQNGIRAEEILAQHVLKENIYSSIVMFGATYLEHGKVVHNFDGSWVLGRLFEPRPDERLINMSLTLDKVTSVVISDTIRAMKYLKIFVNANNCIPAILGISMQEAFSDIAISQISIAIWKEGFEIISKANIQLASLPGFPVENLTTLTALPAAQAAGIFSGIILKLSKDPVYGSILQSIMRGRPSEIDYINGEFVRLAQESGGQALLNKKLVAMVHEVERTRTFFSKEALIKEAAQLTGPEAG